MPHCIVEYSENLTVHMEVPALLEQLNQTLLDCGLFTPSAIKLRAMPFRDYVLPHDYEHFIHLRMHLLEGRTNEQKSELSIRLHDTVEQIVSKQGVSVTVEICDIHKPSYQK